VIWANIADNISLNGCEYIILALYKLKNMASGINIYSIADINNQIADNTNYVISAIRISDISNSE